jgi:putative oxidoreductase
MLLSVLRIMTGLLFLEHGTGKILGFPPGLDQLPPGIPHAMLYFNGPLEIVGGVLILLGLFTRPVAFVLSGYMAVAYFLTHFKLSFFPALNFGEPAVLFCFVLQVRGRSIRNDTELRRASTATPERQLQGLRMQRRSRRVLNRTGSAKPPGARADSFKESIPAISTIHFSLESPAAMRRRRRTLMDLFSTGAMSKRLAARNERRIEA